MELKKKMGKILCQTQNRFQKLQSVQKRKKSFWNDLTFLIGGFEQRICRVSTFDDLT
jgi:hypothetical protein